MASKSKREARSAAVSSTASITSTTKRSQTSGEPEPAGLTTAVTPTVSRSKAGRASHDLTAVTRLVAANMASVSPSGAGPPLPVLYLMPKSSSGPPGLCDAVRITPP